jgi:CubicO group peptidase (beta-lactamase class C family)
VNTIILQCRDEVDNAPRSRRRTSTCCSRRPCSHRVRFLSRHAAIVLAAFMAAPAARSQQGLPLPGTKPGELVGELLKLCDTPRVDEITTWLMANEARSIVAGGAVGFVAHSIADGCMFDGGLRPQRVIGSDPNAITVLVSGKKTNVWYRLTLATSTDGKIVRRGQQATVPPEDYLPKDLSDAAIRADLKHLVSQLSAAGRFSGIVVVARGRKEIVSVSAGYADRSRRSPITARAQFTLGSMGKLFTATAIGQLVDAHNLSFSDPVGKFFPDYPNTAVREKVTVGMLLSHTAGLGDFLANRTPEMMKNGVKRAAQFMPLYDRDEPKFEPGTRWAYSNAGLALAGAILENASGEDYPDYLRRHIFAPAGMAASDPNNLPHRSADLVIPYTHQTPRGPSPDWQVAPGDLGSPGGGAISTADDLVRFADSLRSGKLVSRATFDEMAKNQDPVPGGPHYGYGMGIDDVYGSTVVGHNGGFPGVSTELQVFLNAPYTIVVLANEDPPAAEYVSARAVALIAAKVKEQFVRAPRRSHDRNGGI